MTVNPWVVTFETNENGLPVTITIFPERSGMSDSEKAIAV
jgi:hypothetical protein